LSERDAYRLDRLVAQRIGDCERRGPAIFKWVDERLFQKTARQVMEEWWTTCNRGKGRPRQSMKLGNRVGEIVCLDRTRSPQLLQIRSIGSHSSDITMM
jgi:hypothetical protein